MRVIKDIFRVFAILTVLLTVGLVLGINTNPAKAASKPMLSRSEVTVTVDETAVVDILNIKGIEKVEYCIKKHLGHSCYSAKDGQVWGGEDGLSIIASANPDFSCDIDCQTYYKPVNEIVNINGSGSRVQITGKSIGRVNLCMKVYCMNAKTYDFTLQIFVSEYSEAEISKNLQALRNQKGFKTNTKWDMNSTYCCDILNYKARACGGFSMKVQDSLFGKESNIRFYDRNLDASAIQFNNLRIGDEVMLSLDEGYHSAIIVKKDYKTKRFWVVSGNNPVIYGNKVRGIVLWGDTKKMKKEYYNTKDIAAIMTRY